MTMINEEQRVELTGVDITGVDVALRGVAVTGVLSGDIPQPVSVFVQGGSTIPGTPVALPGSTLPVNYRWADRSAALFADWPDLKAVYDAGLLDVLPAEATEAEKAAHPGKWVRNGCGNGLFLPDIGGRFARDWRPGQTDDAERGVGTRQGDAIRNITGEAQSWSNRGLLGINREGVAPTSGCFTAGAEILPYAVGYANTHTSRALVLDASRVVPTAEENRPLNDARPVAIYMGRRAQDMQ